MLHYRLFTVQSIPASDFLLGESDSLAIRLHQDDCTQGCLIQPLPKSQPPQESTHLHTFRYPATANRPVPRRSQLYEANILQKDKEAA